MSDFQENGFLSKNNSVNQQCQYTIRKLISKLAPSWFKDVKVIDLTFFWDRLFYLNTIKVGSHDPILVQLSFQIFLCMMKNVGV